MPTRHKRKADDFDPNKSDSADSTYGASTARSAKARTTRSQQGKPSRKRQRRTYGDNDDGSDEISDDSENSEASFEARVAEEEPEIDERTGRPKRKATKNRPAYVDSDDSIEEAPDSAAEEKKTPQKKGKARSLMLKLSLRAPQASVPPVRRSTRARSGSVGVVTRTTPSEPHPSKTRRSSRIAHDESEPIVQLTDSGHHADVVRPGTRSPEAGPVRTRRAAKGVKKVPASVVYEEDEEHAAQALDQQHTEVAASHDDLDEEPDDSQQATKGKTQDANEGDTQLLPGTPKNEVAVIPESGEDEPAEADEEEDEDPINKPRRIRQSENQQAEPNEDEGPGRNGGRSTRKNLRSARQRRKARSSQKSGREESSDFEPGFDDGGEEDISDSEASAGSPQKVAQPNDEDNESPGTRKGKSRGQRDLGSDKHDSEVAEELAEELQDLRSHRPRRTARSEILFDDRPKTRKRKPVDYRILRPDMALPLEDDGSPSATTPSRRARGGGGGAWQRSLFSTYGPFGGAGGPPPVLGGPGGIGAAAGVESDSSDDEAAQRSRAPGVGGVLGMTPTAAAPAGFGQFPPAQAHGADPLGATGTPANVGKIKDKYFLADADPLGVDPNVNFDSVGGLQGHIDQLKEMVALPLLYPEVFQRFHVTPPRGVLFHGPPGTGKTLLARALASSVSSQGRKVTFYMRKGADALSKWVGEAERQLRLLFDEARRTQPSIIFFDEIDGTNPSRSDAPRRD